MALETFRSGRAFEPSYKTHRRALFRLWLHARLPARASSDKLYRRQNTRERGLGSAKPQLTMPRDTRTGGVLEQMVLPSLTRGGYHYRVRVNIGQLMSCGSQYVDAIT